MPEFPRARAAALVACAAVVGASAAGAAPAATNVHIFIGASATPVPSDRLIPPTPNGGTKSIGSLRIFALPHVANTGPDPATFRVRFELAPGLRFATGRPDADAENCTATTTVAECRMSTPVPPGSEEIGWQWEVVVADQSGSYTMRAEILDLSTTDTDPSDNATTITVVLSGSTGAGGGGGGTDTLSASAVTLTPSSPRAGSAVAATVRVSAGTVAVRPTRIACAGRIGALNLRGTPRAASGRATCTFRTQASAKGRLLRGSISFTARGQRVTKRFSVRLR